VVKSEKCMGVSQLLGARALQVYDYVWRTALQMEDVGGLR